MSTEENNNEELAPKKGFLENLLGDAKEKQSEEGILKNESGEVIEGDDEVPNKQFQGDDSTENFGNQLDDQNNSDPLAGLGDIGEGENAIGPGVKELEPDPLSAIEIVKALRVYIDEFLEHAKIEYGVKHDVYKKAFNSKAWLGKLLEQLGSDNPYITKEPIQSKSDIPATSDVANEMAGKIRHFALKGNIQRVEFLRGLMSVAIMDLEGLDFSESVKDGRLAAIAKTQSYVNACETKFALGYELSVIRNS